MFKKNKNHFFLGDLYIESCTGTHPDKSFNKIGRLSLKGVHKNKKVKIFECYNNAHANFLRAVMCHPLYAEFFPKVYGVQGSIIISEWVDGQTLEARHVRNDEAALKKIEHFFEVIHGDIPPEIAKLDYGFDYSKDFLETRFTHCCHTLGLHDFCERVLLSVNKAYEKSSVQLSHSDISPQNILITQDNAQLKIIDNELMGMSSFHHFDLINLSYFLADKKTEPPEHEKKLYEDTRNALSCLNEEDVMNIWLMRHIGAKFQSGQIKAVISFAENSFSENIKLFPFLDVFRSS